MHPELTDCGVRFVESPHGYFYGDKQLCGITSLIHYATGLGEYPEADEYTKSVLIPRAGEYGHAVHSAIELYESQGIRATSTPNTFDGGEWDVSRELEDYIELRGEYIPVANEYTVSNGRYASNIDNVWMNPPSRGIILADTKTNNLNYYPGKTAALKEYLSWQLSIYAELFEQQNPGLKVEKLVGNWLRRGQRRQWMIERKSSDEVNAILSIPYERVDNEFRFIIPIDLLLNIF